MKAAETYTKPAHILHHEFRASPTLNGDLQRFLDLPPKAIPPDFFLASTRLVKVDIFQLNNPTFIAELKGISQTFERGSGLPGGGEIDIDSVAQRYRSPGPLSIAFRPSNQQMFRAITGPLTKLDRIDAEDVNQEFFLTVKIPSSILVGGQALKDAWGHLSGGIQSERINALYTATPHSITGHNGDALVSTP